ncbi:peptidoglycan-binding protein [Leptolyngbya sp. BC1307]|uniref:peptidoglycan-binding domain-containing protein n=1 Tax=Leptolyngbya sp. BC1307 TaxID=2029589 RepID=UPI000EFC6E65|nr:peptidoglycan-binding protein [Leptolyngbya sp. BC1307]
MVRSRNHRRLNEQPLLNKGWRKLFNQRTIYFAGAIALPAILLGLGTPALSISDLGSSRRADQSVTQSIEIDPLIAQPAYPILSAGSTDESVSYLQATLKLLGFYSGSVDGTYSQSTQEAVARFQTAAGIAADGIVGPSTWGKLLPTPEAAQPIPASEAPVEPPTAAVVSMENSPAPAPNGPPVLRVDAVGAAVSQLQSELRTLGYYQGEIDGGYGEQTEAAVKQFQSDQQLLVDGIVGPSTWDALLRALAQ